MTKCSAEKLCLTSSSALGRWKGIGPYYAMFPVEFAFDVVSHYCKEQGSVLDPFAGRASSIFAACAQDRTGIGFEINPVGWVYGEAKLRPGDEADVIERLKAIAKISTEIDTCHIESLPPFFKACYSTNVLRFLLAARSHLNWLDNIVDRTLMALIMVNLHGKVNSSLSNQMRQSKAMAPDYSIRWWAERGMTPPNVDPCDFMLERIKWRYAKGKPNLNYGRVLLGDSTSLWQRLPRIVRQRGKFDLLFTSPPYCGITNYHYDQWLRLWMLGGADKPLYSTGKHKGKFTSKDEYKDLLCNVFSKCAQSMTEDATIYVRTDARDFTLQCTISTLQAAFPGKEMQVNLRPIDKETQTGLYGDKSKKPGEVDIILQ